MSLQALVFCADEKVVRVLRRVLSELEIGMELCPDAESPELWWSGTWEGLNPVI